MIKVNHTLQSSLFQDMWFSAKNFSQYKFCHLISILRPWWILFGSGSEVHRNYRSQTISPVQGKHNKEDNMQKITKMKIIFQICS